MDQELFDTLREWADDDFIEDVMLMFDVVSKLEDKEAERMKQTLTSMVHSYIGHSANCAGVFG